jgi:hypothetical protein
MDRLGFPYTRDISINDEPFALYVLDRRSASKAAAG